MRKLLSLAFLAAILGAAIGCDDKKTSPPAKNTTSPVGGGTPAPGKTT